MWQPSASIPHLRKRAEIIAQVRTFFTDRGYLEVETPIMGRYGTTDVYLSNIKAQFRGQNYNLQTSPEYHMKRLLAAGSGPIFQLARVFRDDELGSWHNPEFTLLEWYQLNIDHHQLMAEMNEFLQIILHCQPLVRLTYQEAFLLACAVDPFNASIDELRAALVHFQLDYVIPADETDADQYLFLLMSHIVEPYLQKYSVPVAVYDFPVSQAALAQVHQGRAQRFEIYYQGVELANGFHELTDAAAQAQRFRRDQQIRQDKGFAEVAADELLLEALARGLPPCSGVALGIDRLIAIALNQTKIAHILAFAHDRA